MSRVVVFLCIDDLTPWLVINENKRKTAESIANESEKQHVNKLFGTLPTLKA